MIARRLVQKMTAAAAFAAAVAVSVVAAGFALYAALRDPLGPAWAAAAVAAVAAVAAWIFALMAGRRAGPDARRDAEHAESPAAGLMDRAADLVRERPLVATAAALAAGWIFIRNPALTTLLAAVLSGGKGDRRH